MIDERYIELPELEEVRPELLQFARSIERRLQKTAEERAKKALDAGGQPTAILKALAGATVGGTEYLADAAIGAERGDDNATIWNLAYARLAAVDLGLLAFLLEEALDQETQRQAEAAARREKSE